MTWIKTELPDDADEKLNQYKENQDMNKSDAACHLLCEALNLANTERPTHD